jgi:hypothetical protein
MDEYVTWQAPDERKPSSQQQKAAEENDKQTHENQDLPKALELRQSDRPPQLVP